MVGKVCCVGSCRHRTEDGESSAGYFFLPGFSKYKIREEWVKILELGEYYMNPGIKKTFFVCYRHFKKEDINTSLKVLKLKKGIWIIFYKIDTLFFSIKPELLTSNYFIYKMLKLMTVSHLILL